MVQETNEFMTKEYYDKNIRPMMFDLNPAGELVYYTASGQPVVMATSLCGAASTDILKMLVDTKYYCDEISVEIDRLKSAVQVIEATIDLLSTAK